jgi:hypothetical protein
MESCDLVVDEKMRFLMNTICEKLAKIGCRRAVHPAADLLLGDPFHGSSAAEKNEPSW